MLLQLEHITKTYPGVVALDDVNFTVEAGEIHCLLGENGAGKSTLVKILSGAIRADGGTISISESVAHIDSPPDAQRLGIATIYQDFKLVPELTVAENIFLGHEPTSTVFRLVDHARMEKNAGEILARLGERIDPHSVVRHLSIGQKQIVEIAKALSRNVRVLALDEPTAALTAHEIENVFRVIRTLKNQSVGIIYISHRLDEIFEIGDRVTVLRDGRNVATSLLRDVDRRQLIRWMVGRELEDEYPKSDRTRGEEIFRVEQVCTSKLHDIDLTLHRGEILGLAGLVGAGRSELAHTIFGADAIASGSIALHGKEIRVRSPHEAIRHGIGLVTEDRNAQGLILQMKIRENISLANLHSFVKGILLDEKQERMIARKFVGDLRIKPSDTETPVDSLSGGNRQKVILARWLSAEATLLILDEPTAGVDVGAKYEIYMIIHELAARGIGVIVISSDLPELIGICDRIAVMREGRIMGELHRNEFSQERIMSLATSTFSSTDR